MSDEFETSLSRKRAALDRLIAQTGAEDSAQLIALRADNEVGWELGHFDLPPKTDVSQQMRDGLLIRARSDAFAAHQLAAMALNSANTANAKFDKILKYHFPTLVFANVVALVLYRLFF
ncbi:hypothetical protein [Mesorhizobium sp. M7A.F.Ca.MR.245.00.0.0]|uniref:hypothetical protein n=1 Tax=Mesorhizobium sp. M7A.F.Ca.MR.245.00.0.0 TaxID=2496778 RepID=UPI000FCB7FC2|nr:hypothetical protein [Mesorhizobium sp. M7A.F.Ca.MR.245.00.0.0]RUV19949.1 hypothetical protein EOB80_17170 [Mesorhizobium sp. M7A.F.Ca.MR.245.00.0.0]RUV53796.1 hypothetical protein EOB77_00675 [Mesorhizobium sp. M7A.F.Ca.MR.228.00.0.0]